MIKPPKLFDHSTLRLRRNRAKHCGNEALFLHERAAVQVSERLEEVNRTFKDVAIVGWQHDLWAEILDLKASCVPDAEILDLKQGSFDLIIHALSLHWANDPVGQLVQMRRALRPDGLMIAVFFGGQTLQELRIAFAEAETEIDKGISPRIAPMGEIRDLGSLLQRAGYALPVADSDLVLATYQTPLHLAHDLRAMGETNVIFDRKRQGITRRLWNRCNKIYAAHFSNECSRIKASFELVFLTGWAPSKHQPKPLRPGSAQSRLADALGVAEQRESD